MWAQRVEGLATSVSNYAVLQTAIASSLVLSHAEEGVCSPVCAEAANCRRNDERRGQSSDGFPPGRRNGRNYMKRVDFPAVFW